MANDNYMLISLDDSKSKSIAEVIGSKTCKKIISYLSENKEASQKDLSDALDIPLNTMEYNIKKLLDSGFIQKTKNFFWSKKGKKIIMYELSNKSIVISHKKKISEKIKSIIPAFILTAVGTFAVWTYEKIKLGTETLAKSAPTTNYDDAALAMAESGNRVAETIPPQDLLPMTQGTPLWIWFLIGSLITLFVISIVNWRKL
jgi:DeoR/GlpR family transcriptional regulator of sugar metabolism